MKRLITFLICIPLVVACRGWFDSDNGSVSIAPPPPGSIQTPVELRAALEFGVLAHSTVTSIGATHITGDIGVDPGSAITGFPPGTITGDTHVGDATALAAQSALTAAYNDAASRASDATIAGNIGGRTFRPGVYKSTSSLALSSGDLTLDGKGHSDSVFIFEVASSLTVTSGRKVILTGGTRPENIFWQVGSSATFGTTVDFSGQVMALQSISLATGATLHGRALARNGAVTLQSNVITN